MPDFERITDGLELDLCRSEESRQFFSGKIAGKRYARIEIIGVCVLIALIYATALVISS